MGCSLARVGYGGGNCYYGRSANSPGSPAGLVRQKDTPRDFVRS
jgi:hypothetical protein